MAVELNLSSSKLEGLNLKILLINLRGFGRHSAEPVIAMIDLRSGELTLELPAPSLAASPELATDETAAALLASCSEHLTGFKCPRSVDFVDELPRLPTGKLLKRILHDRYRTTN